MEVCAISLKLRKHVTFIVAWFMDHRRHRQVLLQGRDIEEGSTRGRKQVWFSNIPHTWLVADKGGQNWITKAKEMEDLALKRTMLGDCEENMFLCGGSLL
ncbi:uncharacterized protein [Triticum aestivum]|uniref:uncharacterized protein isoform X3 n=1 Tax=Triticum aestivum TaxID=4565 RepID=UPI001D01713F|nr:uncharacterized protein LOC123045242 isoform X3 [Triticum aestivum]